MLRDSRHGSARRKAKRLGHPLLIADYWLWFVSRRLPRSASKRSTFRPTALTAGYENRQESWPLPAFGSPPLAVRFSVGGVDSSSAGLTLATCVTICGVTGSILFSRM